MQYLLIVTLKIRQAALSIIANFKKIQLFKYFSISI